MLPMPFEKWTTYPGHSGVDFPQRQGTPIRASGDGVVTQISLSERGGWRVFVLYDTGEHVKYAHMDSRLDILPRVGERVTLDETIAFVGRRGVGSTGYHLHIENSAAAGEKYVWQIFDKNKWIGKVEIASPIPHNTSKEENMYVAIVKHGNIQGSFLVTPQGSAQPTALGLGGSASYSNLPTVEITEFSDSFWKTVRLV